MSNVELKTKNEFLQIFAQPTRSCKKPIEANEWSLRQKISYFSNNSLAILLIEFSSFL